MDMTTIYIVWLRDLRRYFRERSQIMTGIFRPMLWLFVLGLGLRPALKTVEGVDYIKFIFPGMVAMSLLFAAMLSAISIIWDREFGVLKEMLVAPVPRTSIVIGKCFSGATIATMQGCTVLLFSPFLHVPITLIGLVLTVIWMFVVSFSLTSLGILIASRMTSFEGFGAIANFVVMPMFLLSGAMFPIMGLPGWLMLLVRINPVSYGVDLLRGILINHHHITYVTNILTIVGFGIVMVWIATIAFSKRT